MGVCDDSTALLPVGKISRRPTTGEGAVAAGAAELRRAERANA